MTHAILALCLAVSIITSVVVVTSFLPMSARDISRQESLQYNAFFCILLPLVVIYCSQNRILASVISKWVLNKKCSSSNKFDPNQRSLYFRGTKAFGGSDCNSINAFNPQLRGLHSLAGGVATQVQNCFDSCHLNG